MIKVPHYVYPPDIRRTSSTTWSISSGFHKTALISCINYGQKHCVCILSIFQQAFFCSNIFAKHLVFHNKLTQKINIPTGCLQIKYVFNVTRKLTLYGNPSKHTHTHVNNWFYKFACKHILIKSIISVIL